MAKDCTSPECEREEIRLQKDAAFAPSIGEACATRYLSTPVRCAALEATEVFAAGCASAALLALPAGGVVTWSFLDYRAEGRAAGRYVPAIPATKQHA